MRTKTKRHSGIRYRGRRLRPQFLIFCAVVALLLIGMAVLLVRCASHRSGGNEKPAVQTSGVKVPDGYIEAQGDIRIGTLLLIGNDHPYAFAQDVAMTTMWDRAGEDYLVRDYSVSLQTQAADAFDAMLKAFAAATGKKDVNITSAYRSYEEQQEVFNASAAQNGQEHAGRYVTQPGCSEHHSGLAVDFSIYNVGTRVSYDFDGTGDYQWINDHCADYGIILRYPSSKESITGIALESWHFRYVGKPHAAYMVRNDLCLEEYMDVLRDHTVDKPLGFEGYTIYFCPEGALYVPRSGNYTVSGNNVDGFIVTVG